MRDETPSAGGWIAGTRYSMELEAHSPRPLPVMEAAGCTDDFLTVPPDAFTPPARAPVRLRREGRAVYALRETAEEASAVLAGGLNDQIAKRKGTA